MEEGPGFGCISPEHSYRIDNDVAKIMIMK